MNSFIVSHELSHLLVRWKDIPKDENWNDQKARLEEEVACDIIGCKIAALTVSRLCKDAYTQSWQRLGLVGSLFFLASLNIIEKAAYVMQKGHDVPKIMEKIDFSSQEKNLLFSYPTPILRFYVVRATLAKEFQRAQPSSATDWIFDACDWIEAIFDDCWSQLSKNFLHLFETHRKVMEYGRELEKISSSGIKYRNPYFLCLYVFPLLISY